MRISYHCGLFRLVTACWGILFLYVMDACNILIRILCYCTALRVISFGLVKLGAIKLVSSISLYGNIIFGFNRLKHA